MNHLYFSLTLSCALVLGAQGAPVHLLLQEGGVGNTAYIFENGFATVSTDFGGDIYADVTINPVSGKPQTFRYLEGGLLTYSDGSTTFTPTTIPPPDDSYEFIYSGLKSVSSTKPGGGTVNQTTCLLEQSEHETELVSGTITFKWFFQNNLIFESTQDYSQDSSKGDNRGATEITASLLSLGIVEDRYLVTLDHDSTHTEDGTSNPWGVTIDESGGFTATGEVLVPSEGLSQWVISSGGPAPGDGSDLLGSVPVAILYALGLAVGEQEIPWILDPLAGQATLSLPATGTRAALVIETSPDLENWSQQSLVGGTAGSVLITLPVGHSFLRLAMPSS